VNKIHVPPELFIPPRNVPVVAAPLEACTVPGMTCDVGSVYGTEKAYISIGSISHAAHEPTLGNDRGVSAGGCQRQAGEVPHMSVGA